MFHEILKAGDLSLRSDFDTREAWQELVDADLVNIWTDDSGMTFVEIGHQQ